MNRSSLLSIALSSAALVASPAVAADGDMSASADAIMADAGEDANEGGIIVTGRFFTREPATINAPVILSGETLIRKTRAQLGDTLATMPGVSASSFAPGASRPVLRGFDAARVRLLSEGVGSLDASTVSADHAVAIDTLTVERIDVLHGAEVLLYAGDPAGGAVNVLDHRIPRSVPENGYSAQATATYGSAADGTSLGASVDVALTSRLVAHIDGSRARAGNLRTGGNVLSPQLRAEVLASAAELRTQGDVEGADTLTAMGNARGTIPNSATRSETVAGGLAFIDAAGDMGVSVQRFTTKYGVPPRPEAGGPAAVSIDLRQTRVDTRGGVNFTGGFLKRLEFRGSYGDYEHQEQHNGTAEATFRSKGIETRLDAIQAEQGGWRGRSGVQFGDRTQNVISDEALIPDNNTQNLALFTLQQLRAGAFDFEVAGRFENVKVRAKPNGLRRGYDLWSGVAGIAWRPADTLTLHVNIQRGERAPSAEELFVDGIHEASQSYQTGNPAFRTERSLGVEGGLRLHTPGILLSVIGFATDFDDFITPIPTGNEIEGFPVYQFVQENARFYGVEAEASARLASWGDRTLTLDGGADYTHASLVGVGPVPQIPSLRLRSGLEYGSPVLTLRGEVEWNAKQSRVAEFENPTSAFTLVGISASWKPMGADSALTLIASADNLLNVTGRRAASGTRDFVPIAGRDLRITASIQF